jgi:hypothetical protein
VHKIYILHSKEKNGPAQHACQPGAGAPSDVMPVRATLAAGAHDIQAGQVCFRMPAYPVFFPLVIPVLIVNTVRRSCTSY